MKVRFTDKGYTLARFLFDADRWVDADTPEEVRHWIAKWFELPNDTSVEALNEALKQSKAFAAEKKRERLQ